MTRPPFSFPQHMPIAGFVVLDLVFLNCAWHLPWPQVLFILGFSVSLVWGIFKSTINLRFLILSALLTAISCGYLIHQRHQVLAHRHDLDGVNVFVQGRIVSDCLDPDASAPKLELQTAYGKMLLHLSDEDASKLDPRFGDILRFRASLETPDEQRNPGGYDDADQLMRKGIAFRLFSRNLHALRLERSQRYSLYDRLHHLRVYLARSLKQQLGDRYRIPAAMLLADSSLIDKESLEAYRTLGLSHILVTSGAHVSLLIEVLALALKKLPCTILLRRSITVLFVLAYTMLTGFAPSAVRAALASVLHMLCSLYDRPMSSMHRMLLTLYFMMKIWPTVILQTGFRISLIMTLGILAFTQMNPSSPEPTTSAFKLQVFMTCLALPIQLEMSGSYHLLNVPLNLSVSPLLQWINILCIPLVLLAPLPILKLMTYPLAVLIKGGMWLIDQIINAAFHATRWNLLAPSYWRVLIYPLLFVLIVIWVYRQRSGPKATPPKLLLIGSASVMMLIWVISYVAAYKPTLQARACMIDVDQGDAIYLRLSWAQHLLIDTGPEGSMHYLWNGFRQAYGIPYKVQLLLTHLDADHAGDALFMIQKGFVSHLYLSEAEYEMTLNGAVAQEEKESYQEKIQRLHAACLAQKIPLTFLRDEDQWSSEHAKLRVLPGPKKLKDSNDASLVLNFTMEHVSMLLTGDAEEHRERYWMDEGMADPISILKVGHHGSKHASSLAWMKMIQPKLALISVGRNNRYRHPSKEVLERLEQLKIPYYRTDLCGAIALEFAGEDVRLKPYLNRLTPPYDRIEQTHERRTSQNGKEASRSSGIP